MINVVYHEAPPFIHRNANDSLTGIILDIAEQLWEFCGIKLQFAIGAGSEKNFILLIANPKMISNYTGQENEWIWMSLIKRVPPETFKRLPLFEYHLFQSPWVEVIVHRDQIGIISKVLIRLSRCQHLFLMITLLKARIHYTKFYRKDIIYSPKSTKHLLNDGEFVSRC